MPKKIIVIDDDTEVRQYLKTVLETKGYIVELADGGKKALVKLKEQHFDLVILDLIMPDLDGFDVLRTIRSSGNSIPVVILTAYDNENRLKEAISLGATNFVGKGDGIDVIMNKVESCLNISLSAKKEKEVDILVVEDEKAEAEYYVDMLKEGGYSVEIARRGEEAITRVIKYNPKLVILDIMLPDIDGIEVLRQIRKVNDKVKIFVISAYIDNLGESTKYAMDVYAVLNKPVGSDELRRYVREALTTALTPEKEI